MSKLRLRSKLWWLGVATCAVVLSRDPDSLALASILTDCTDPLDQEGETYVLSGNTENNCTIQANNITLDGLGLYSINSGITGGAGPAPYTGLIVQNVVSVLTVSWFGLNGHYTNGGDGGTITIENSTVTGNVYSKGGYAYYGVAGNGGLVTITNSNIGGDVSSPGGNSFGGTSGGGGDIVIVNSEVTGAITSAAGSDGYGGGIGVAGNISITDSTVTGAVSGAELTLVDNGPTITLVGDNPLALEFADTYEEPGATATDTKDGTLTDDIVITGTVGATAGDHILTYTVEDEGTTITWNGGSESVAANSTSTTRTVTRGAAPVVAETPVVASVTGGSTARGRAIRLQQREKTNEVAPPSNQASPQEIDRLRTALRELLLQFQNLLIKLISEENSR